MAPKRKGDATSSEVPRKDSAKRKAVPVDDAEDRNAASKAEISKMLGLLKYRADPKTNKKGEQMEDAIQALKARFS